MNYITDKLCVMYMKYIRQKYEKEEKTVNYISYSYYRSDSSAVCNLAYIQPGQVLSLMEQGIIKANEIDINEYDTKLYNACLLYSEYNMSSAIDMYINNLYRSENDGKLLRKAILAKHSNELTLLEDKKIQEKMKFTPEEINIIINNCLTSFYNINTILNNHFDKLSEEHKEKIISILLLDKPRAMSIFENSNLPDDFILRLFRSNFLEENYLDIFHSIYHHTKENNIIRNKVFDYLIGNDNYFYDTFDPLIDGLNAKEKMLVCNKFYKYIFADTSSYRKFLLNCIRFGQYLRKPERMLLIRKMKTKTRIKNIPTAKKNIKFSEDELDQLKSIELMHKLL